MISVKLAVAGKSAREFYLDETSGTSVQSLLRAGSESVNGRTIKINNREATANDDLRDGDVVFLVQLYKGNQAVITVAAAGVESQQVTIDHGWTVANVVSHLRTNLQSIATTSGIQFKFNGAELKMNDQVPVQSGVLLMVKLYKGNVSAKTRQKRAALTRLALTWGLSLKTVNGAAVYSA